MKLIQRLMNGSELSGLNLTLYNSKEYIFWQDTTWDATKAELARVSQAYPGEVYRLIKVKRPA